MIQKQLIACTILLLSTTPLFAQAEAENRLKSGLQVGDTIASFNVLDVTGPAKGKSICYACRFGHRPVVNVFVRQLTPETVTLIRELDRMAAKHEDEQLKVFVVFLSMDPESDGKQLVELNQKHKLDHAPLTIFDGITGPKKCRIAEHAAVTVIMWKSAKVIANHASATGKLDEETVASVLADVPKILNAQQ